MLESLINLSASIFHFLLKFPNILTCPDTAVQHTVIGKNIAHRAVQAFLYDAGSGLSDLMSFGINPHPYDKIITDGISNAFIS